MIRNIPLGSLQKTLQREFPEDIPQVLEKIYGYIIRQNSNFYSNWLVRFIKCLPDRHNAQEMAKKLYENGFIKQGIALLAVIDDDAFSNLNFLWEYVATKKLEYDLSALALLAVLLCVSLFISVIL